MTTLQQEEKLLILHNMKKYRLVGNGFGVRYFDTYAEASAAATDLDYEGSGWEFDLEEEVRNGIFEVIEHHLGY